MRTAYFKALERYAVRCFYLKPELRQDNCNLAIGDFDIPMLDHVVLE